jgi:ubiquinone biosynthesis UbiH/UbiF/VisC/COQ6 family hydroxylase
MQADVAVVGRGAVGLTAALALARIGLPTTLIGAPPSVDAGTVAGDDVDPWDLRVFALSPATRALLESIGVWHALDAARIAPVYDMRVFPAFTSDRDVLHFSAYEARVEALAWIVEQRNLMRALGQAVRFAGLQIVDEAFDRVDADPRTLQSASGTVPEPTISVGLEGGRRLSVRLLVGADGAGSRVRESAALTWSVSDYPQRALVAHFDTGRPHRDIAWQWFGRDGILALLPLPLPWPPATAPDAPQGRVSMVWSAPPELADALLAMTSGELAARVQQAAGAALGTMSAISRVQAFPLRLGRVASMVGHRVALVGDAAHLVHPLAGQGMNLGFGDVAALVRVLREGASGGDPGDRLLLRRYARARAEPVAAMRSATDALQRLFDPTRRPAPAALAPLVESALALGWRAVAGSRWFRRQLVAQAVR